MLVQYYVRFLAQEFADSAGSDGCSERVHVRPLVAHDEYLVGIVYKGFHSVGDDSRLAAVVLFERLQGAAVIPCAVICLDYGLVASASEGQLQRCLGELRGLQQR